MSEQRYRSTAGPALASMDNWNAQQNRRPVMQMSSEERVKLNDIVGELRDWQRHFNPAVEDDNNWYRGECDIDGKDAASIGEVCRDAADLIELLTTRPEPAADAVERVAKALFDHWLTDSGASSDEIEEAWQSHLSFTKRYDWEPSPKVFEKARLALQAAAEPAGDDVDLTTAYMTGYLAGKDAVANARKGVRGD